MKRDITQLISQMTLEEKAAMCSGADFWHLKGIERLGIPSVMLCDGPHGLRKQEQAADHLGINDSIKAVCFPTACAGAASFDTELLYKLGDTLGAQCRSEGIGVLLGPAVNIKRSPLCGRNFEYFSEDPFLAGQLCAAQIKGVQSHNVGACVKHFAANNQEYHRLTCSSEIDERSLREIYLAPFEAAVKQAKVWTVMCSYNKINGEQVSESKRLMSDILRDEWGFEGYVMSDWGAVNDRAKGLSAGLDLEMPSPGPDTDIELARAVKEGRVAKEDLDKAVARILRVIFLYHDADGEKEFDLELHHKQAADMACECAVLLKNEGGVLPLNKAQKLAFIGEFAQKPRFQGGGSSHINAFRQDNALAAAADMGACVQYAKAYAIEENEADEELIAQAVSLAASCEAAVIFAGLPDSFECEGYDRSHMRLPDCQLQLIERVAKVQPNTIVVLHNGSPIEMPWLDKVKAVLEMYLAGQGVGSAAVRLLYGAENPSGKLPESFPLRLEDNPSYLNFPGDGDKVIYSEGVFVGYRYYDKKNMQLLFPFGHGLSYTEFEYSNLIIDKQTMYDKDTLSVTVDIKNIGKCSGKEAVQLYVGKPEGKAVRPVKELKGFTKLSLCAGKTARASFVLDKRSFAYYDTNIGDFVCEQGEYQIMIAASSRDIRLCGTVNLVPTHIAPFIVDANSRYDDLLAQPRLHSFMRELMDKYYPHKEPAAGAAREAITPKMQRSMDEEAPLRGLRAFRGFTQHELDALIAKLNQMNGLE